MKLLKYIFLLLTITIIFPNKLWSNITIKLDFVSGFNTEFLVGGEWENVNVYDVKNFIVNRVTNDYSSYNNISISTTSGDLIVSIGESHETKFGHANGIGYYIDGSGAAEVYSNNFAKYSEWRGEDNATVERIGEAIAGTTSHEIGHLINLYHAYMFNSFDPTISKALKANYQPKEPDDETFPESCKTDTTKHYHLMATRGFIEFEQRATINRYFSDNSDQILKFAQSGGCNVNRNITWGIVSKTFNQSTDVTIASGKTLIIASGGYIHNLNGYDLVNNNGTITIHGTLRPGEIMLSGGDDYYSSVSSAFNAGNTVQIKSYDGEGFSVPSGKTLDIDAGVTIKIAKDNQISVTGTITAYGTDGNLITFTSAESSPDHGDWNGILLQSGFEGFDLSYCKIEYVKCGIKSIDDDNYIYIDNSEIADCDTGFYLNNSDATMYKSEIDGNGNYDAFYLKNYSYLELEDLDHGKGYNKIHYNMIVDYHSHGEWGEFDESGYNSFYGAGGFLILKDSSWVMAENNYWNDIEPSVGEGSYLNDDHKLGSPPPDPKVPARDIDDWEIEQLFLEARIISLKNPEKSWDMFKDIIEKYPDSKFASYSLARMKVISKKIQNNDLISYLKYIIDNKPSMKKMALEISINQLIKKGMIQNVLTNCFYLLANYPDNKIKNYVLYEMFRIYLDYLGDSSNADRVLADLKEVDANSNSRVLPFALNILDNFNNSKLDRKIVDITFSYPNYPADIEGYKETESEKMTAGIPKTFVLHQNYPNPFNPVTTIKYDLPEASDIKITVYNILGQEIVTLINDHLNAGSHEMKWDASMFSSGIYICRLEAGSYTKSIKLLLMK